MQQLLTQKDLPNVPKERYLTPFGEFYENLPTMDDKRAFIDKVISETGKNRVSVYRWINGDFQPEAKLERKLISDITGIPEETLFPKNQ